ncbi:Predicted membrane protein [Wolbachia endosymbiont of Culex quinquefasciatus JHB]|uniref:hypothetical protein n=1 Tax=Wolbachia endosymbiont of Culex quinquefasciatus TaxID=263437 RepID=UPI000184899E|nr:Predicted membrane protein [Wolbachia endosymbiont of Culex quinquefasciatus JHB]
MNQVVADGHREVIDLNNNSDGSGKVESISNVALEEEEEFFDAMEDVSNVEEGNDLGLATSEEKEEFFDAMEQQESTYDLEEVEEFFDSKAATFDIPLSIFHYKDYNSDFFTSWYNMSSEILKEINRACPEKKILNLALSVLMLPYIAFTALGLVIYSRFKANSKTQEGVVEDKTKKSETGVPKRLAYGALAAMAIFVNVTVLVALVVPATIALATFYLLNRDLSHSLVAALKISMGHYSNKHQNIEVSFYETVVYDSRIKYDMEIKFPPQFKQLLRDLCENENNQWFSAEPDSEHNIVLKLPININLKNGLKPLHNEIKNVLATSIQEFAKTMEELMKLEKKEITYDQLKELLNEFRLKVVSSIDSKLTTHLIENAYQVAFIQAIKFQQNRRGEDFSLEDELKNTLVKQKLESQGKELPNEKEVIIKDLKELKIKELLNLTDEDDRLESLMKVDDISDDALPVFKAKWKQLIKEGKIAERTIINTYEDMYPQETKKALDNAEREIEDLREIVQIRYNSEKLKEMHKNRKNGNLKDGALKRKLEDFFKFEYDGQKVEEMLIESRIRTIQTLPNKSDKKIKQCELNEIRISGEVNDFVEKMYLEITRCRIQELFEKQGESIKNVEDNKDRLFNGEDEKRLVNKIVSYRKEIGEYFTQPTRLKEIIGKQNEDLDVEKNSKEEKSSSMELIELCLRNNQEILKTLEQLKLEEKGLLINEKTINDYREELESREKIKFAIIEDDLLKAFEHEIFNEEAIKKLLERAELEYYLAEKCIKSPVIKTKDNIKHFCQDLLSPLINRLVENIVNNVPKSDKSSWLQPIKAIRTGLGYIQTGLAVAMRGDKSTEGKALSVAHDTHKEVETFLQHFQSSYEEVGVFFWVIYFLMMERHLKMMYGLK